MEGEELKLIIQIMTLKSSYQNRNVVNMDSKSLIKNNFLQIYVNANTAEHFCLNLLTIKQDRTALLTWLNGFFFLTQDSVQAFIESLLPFLVIHLCFCKVYVYRRDAISTNAKWRDSISCTTITKVNIATYQGLIWKTIEKYWQSVLSS